MTSLEFVYWLQGFLEISQPEVISKEQIDIIQEHIALVLRKNTNSVSMKPATYDFTGKLITDHLGPQPEKRYMVSSNKPLCSTIDLPISYDDNTFKVHNTDEQFVKHDGLTKEVLDRINCTFLHEGSC